MTRRRRDRNEEPFSQWVRAHPSLGSASHEAALSITDLDYIVHQYKVWDFANGRPVGRVHLMNLELKTRGVPIPLAQRDTLQILDQLCWAGHKKRVRTLIRRDKVCIYYHGLHVLQMSGTDPGNSRWMKWGTKAITEEKLVDVLRFRLDAYTLRPREDRSHHKADPLLDEEWVTAI